PMDKFSVDSTRFCVTSRSWFVPRLRSHFLFTICSVMPVDKFLLDIRGFLDYARARGRESVIGVAARSCLGRSLTCARGVPVPSCVPVPDSFLCPWRDFLTHTRRDIIFLRVQEKTCITLENPYIVKCQDSLTVRSRIEV
ncbi:hypothetical protein LCGC14_1676630, partial [marine sediment metagenome]